MDNLWLSLDSKREKILAKAATLGADAVILGDLRLPPLDQGNPTAGQSSPPSSLPPKDVDKPKADDLRSSSARDDILGADVRVVLVHGGGHGGGMVEDTAMVGIGEDPQRSMESDEPVVLLGVG